VRTLTSLLSPSGVLVLFALALVGCSVPYPLLTSGGPFEVPPSPSHDPLDDRGGRVLLVPAAPANCRFLGLATGVGGVTETYQGGSDSRYGEFQAQAVVALRNAVGAAGGTHTIVDAEVTFFNRMGGSESTLAAVLVRGPALACPR